MLIENTRATRGDYGDELRAIMSIAKARESRRWLAGWPQLSPTATPLWPLPDLARAMGVARVELKDESTRAHMGSFKALGAPIALIRLIQRRWPGAAFTADALFAGHHAAQLSEFTVVSATDGNHGRSLAAAAHDIGCHCVIVLHKNVSLEREQAIASHGARIVRIEGNYDASVEEAARLAGANGWQVVSDTSYEGYEEIPRDVMQGYGTIVDEILEQRPAASDAPCPYTHVFLQGGVGGLAAGIASYFCEQYGARRPAFIVVEPRQADCLCQSALAGQAAQASGSVDSVMAGLACGETSPLAWRFLQPAVDFFLAIEDGEAVSAMRRLAQVQDANGDVPVVSGESGAAGLAGLIHLASDPALRARTRLDAQASVLLISTEGATAPGVYRELVGKGAQDILAAQISWLDEGAA
ncbi:MAG: diaminopropionate ammonia-lyase [Delftia acidovorans]|uniref:Diaminopropionate ammonia-lyase n=1 Tax=Delftia acidovorans TaxID=80866 RepID=A0A7T2S9B8_DELAC|nr:diaminopropionate ammonia-lyase [Delftia acidovorans]MBL8353949.1 diaminopropionate ammonia-lyase [Delftia acidovorans]QPS11339.1 diaminopropionate ammonia-lyase [Delftia acidovorans]